MTIGRTSRTTHLTDAEVTQLREQYATDTCTCGHPRSLHYGQGGSTGKCLAPGCRCWDYAWRDAGCPWTD